MTATVKTPEEVLENFKRMLSKECYNFEIENKCTTHDTTVVFITYDFNDATHCVIIIDKGNNKDHIYFSPNNTYGTVFDIFVCLRFALTGTKY